MPRSTLLLLALMAALPAASHALCTSDGTPQPSALLERFVNADCEACWRDPATPAAEPGTLALDWVVPGSKGEDAPLSAVAIRDAQERLRYLGRPDPQSWEAARANRIGSPWPLRLAQGEAFNDYIAGSIELQGGGT